MSLIDQKYNFTCLRGKTTPGSTIIAVGGGKGGVGKSFVSSSIALFLARMGHRTILIDLDLGAANLHTLLGESFTKTGINEFIKNPAMTFDSVIHQTQYPHLSLVSGGFEEEEIARINDQQRARLMSSIYHLPSDFIVLDLSAGTHPTTVDFFLMAQRKLVVMTPEPSSMENAYRFMKSAFHRKLKRFEFQLRLQSTINEIMTNRHKLGVRAPADLLRVIASRDLENGERFRGVMESLRFEVILNQTRSLKDVDLGPSIKTVCNKYFGVPCDYLGHMEYDNAVWQSLRKRRPLLIEYPQSRLYMQLMKVSRQLAKPNLTKAAS